MCETSRKRQTPPVVAINNQNKSVLPEHGHRRSQISKDRKPRVDRNRRVRDNFEGNAFDGLDQGRHLSVTLSLTNTGYRLESPSNRHGSQMLEFCNS